MKSLVLVFIILIAGIFENVTKIVMALEEDNKERNAIHSKEVFSAAANQSSTISKKLAVLSKTVSLSTTVAAPTLSVKPVSLTGFTTIVNQPSVTKSYNLIATNLANGIKATATAPAGYEISVHGTTTFSANLTLTQTTTGVINRIILVRLKAQAASGSFTGNITNSVAGLSKTVAVSGTTTTSLSAKRKPQVHQKS